jgi:hypothetical protein
MRSVIAYYILIAACALCPAQDTAMVREDHAFVEAVNRADSAALDRLIDNDFTWTDFEGKTRTKAEVLRDIPSDLSRTPAAHSKTTGGRALENIDSKDTGRVAREQAGSKYYTYGDLGDAQENFGRMHVLRVWAKRSGGWKAIVYQEVMSLDAPPSFAPGAGKDCENPCKGVPYQPKNRMEQEVVAAYSKLETAAMAHNSAVFGTLVADEFVAASSNSNKLYDKRGRMDDFDHSKMAGVAPTPLVSARMFDFGDAVLMTSEHTPDRGKPLRVTRVWIRRNGSWMETVSYQTSRVTGQR